MQIPALVTKKAVRFQIKCPKCLTLNELRSGPQKDKVGQKRKEPSSSEDASEQSVAPEPAKPREEASKPEPPKQKVKNEAKVAKAESSALSREPAAQRPPAGPSRPQPQPAQPKGGGSASRRGNQAAGSRRRTAGGGGSRGSAARRPKAGGDQRSPSGSSKGGVHSSSTAKAGSAGGAAAADPSNGVETSAELLDDFVIEEAAERLPVRAGRVRGRGPNGRKTVGGKPSVWAASAYERAFPNLTSSTSASCEQAYEQAPQKPRWQVNDEVEVAFEGKGFEGSWAGGTIAKLDGPQHVLVRYFAFVDTDGSPLVEHMPIERLRLPAPPCHAQWVPALGEPIEGLWNDCWWEGSAREFHATKGILFQYDRWHANWIWLPLRCTRPRPPFSLYYPARPPPESAEADEERSGRLLPGVCGSQGCMLPNNHGGLCQVRVKGSRRDAVRQKLEVQQQVQLYQQIQLSKESRQQVRRGPPPARRPAPPLPVLTHSAVPAPRRLPKPAPRRSKSRRMRA